MFWTVLKIVLFLAVVAGLVWGAEALMTQEAGLRLAVGNTEFTLGPVQMAIAALLLLAGLWLLMRLVGLTVAVLRFINGDETAISRHFERNRRRRGLEALTDGFMALAAGEGEKALTKGRKAEKLLEDQALTTLLIAQAAQVKGNTALAEDYYKRLLEDDRSRFVGVQGLLAQQVEAGNATKARKLAETALTLRPGHAPTQDRLLMLQNQAGDWSGARRTLLETTRSGRLPKPVFKRRDAVLTLQQAEAEEAAGNTALAQDLAIEANRESPELVPAAVMAARALAARGKGQAAAKLIKRAWKAQPHPELAQAFAAIAPDEAPSTRLKRFEPLLALTPGPEAQMTRAELLIAAEDFPAARRAMADLHETHPTQRVMTIMAAIERGEGSPDQVVRGWLARALIAPKGPQWVCENCHHVHAGWHALCAHCGAFDTLGWTETPDSSGPSATGTEMLPLIVGALPAADLPETVEPEPAPEPEVADVIPPEPEKDDAAAEAEVIDLNQTRRMGL
ncbi:heme biosynthesis protein HemY [Pararhodobacter aggregans]|uniref:Heme biosynthesis protein HemY n=1 Tax=Pararhodobacter aggregans TaxID=404875 RepID=A0A2T7UQG9_9RHOB|nr:heme biosynthesis HemY N-terminal domain-containing protein [Pararhodobacter aggregans]PTX01620.1 HemY protein [Pararhodobacter aggregans]PVE46879.1 heme biosynthesis protein HemY [Pararhodobacter aggregans]